MKKFLALLLAPLYCLPLFAAAQTPIVRLGELVAKPDQVEVFQSAVSANITASINQEPQMLTMFAMPKQDQPNDFYVFEMYQTQEGIAQHRTQAHYQTFNQQTQDSFSAKSLTEVEPLFISESREPLMLGGNYVVRAQTLTFAPANKNAIVEVLKQYRSQQPDNPQPFLAVYAITEKNKPDTLHVIEVYRSQADFDAHHSSALYQDFRKAFKPLLLTQDENILLGGQYLMNKGGASY